MIRHFDKVDNSANLPEVRSIEDFWSILKAKVYENNWEAKTLHQLEVRIKKCLKEMDQVTINNKNKSSLATLSSLPFFECENSSLAECLINVPTNYESFLD